MNGIIAAVLLTFPEGHDDNRALLICLHADLVAMAIDGQVADVGAAKTANPDQWSVQWARQAWTAYGACPFAEEAERFVDRATLVEMMKANDAWRCYLRQRLAIDMINAEMLYEGKRRADRTHEAYLALHSALTAHPPIYHKRSYLHQLRDHIGYQNFYLGRIPGPCD